MRSEDNLYICVYVNFEFRLRQTVVYLKGGVLLGNSKLHSLKVNVLFVLFRSNFSLGLIGVPLQSSAVLCTCRVQSATAKYDQFQTNSLSGWQAHCL